MPLSIESFLPSLFVIFGTTRHIYGRKSSPTSIFFTDELLKLSEI